MAKLNDALALFDQPQQAVQIASQQVRLVHMAGVLKRETLNRKFAEEQRLLREKVYANLYFA